MPTILMRTAVADGDFAAQAGEEVQVSAERAQAWVGAGFCELVRSHAPETPEGRSPGAGRPEGAQSRKRITRAQKTTQDVPPT